MTLRSASYILLLRKSDGLNAYGILQINQKSWQCETMKWSQPGRLSEDEGPHHINFKWRWFVIVCVYFHLFFDWRKHTHTGPLIECSVMVWIANKMIAMSAAKIIFVYISTKWIEMDCSEFTGDLDNFGMTRAQAQARNVLIKNGLSFV